MDARVRIEPAEKMAARSRGKKGSAKVGEDSRRVRPIYLPTRSCPCKAERILIMVVAASTQVLSRWITASEISGICCPLERVANLCLTRINIIGRVAMIVHCFCF